MGGPVRGQTNMQPPSNRDDKANPYAMPSAWPRAPQQVFQIRLPKRPGAVPARPSSTILTGSALPEPGYTAPQPPAQPEPEPEPAPAFVAPPQTPFAPPRRARRSRTPLIAGAAFAAIATAGAAALLLMAREETAPAPVASTETLAPAVTPAAPVITPPAIDYIFAEPEESEPRETTFAPAVRTEAPPPAAELPSEPVPYSGEATAPAPPVVAVQPPAPRLILPPITDPGPTSLPDPEAPLTTRDPTSGN